MPTCSCGEKENHVVAKRKTADGKTVELWCDGLVQGPMGFGIRGVGAPRGIAEKRLALKAGWLAMDEVCLYDYNEVGKLVQAARLAVKQTHHEPREFMRRYMAGERFRHVRHGVWKSTKPAASAGGGGGWGQQRMLDLKRHMEACRSLHCSICGTKHGGGKKRHAKTPMKLAAEVDNLLK